MQQALYRKYRSKSLDEVFGQAHITDTLKRALATKRISHAYLLTGPHGVGKTSVARILAHEISGLPYDGTSHLDIIEIDAASNRRIDEIRDLREKARIMPSVADKKVYIIDEVHMLTTEAFNALLKTLEEPPEHVVFILATTESHKLPDTILSRTQRFQFMPIQPKVLEARLKEIAKKESISIEANALQLLIEHANGSFRDAISLIDQFASNGTETVTKKHVETLLGIAGTSQIRSLLTHIQSGDTAKTLKQLQALHNSGFAGAQIASQLQSELREQFSRSLQPSTLQLIEDLLEVQSSRFPERKLEIVLLQAALAAVKSDNTASQTTPSTSKPEPSPQPAKQAIPHTQPSTKLASKPNLDWSSVLSAIKSSNSALYAVLRMAEPRISENKIELAFKFPFHQKRAEQANNRDIIYANIQSTFGKSTEYTTVVDGSITVKEPQAYVEDEVISQPSNEATSVVELMGGGEVIAYED